MLDRTFWSRASGVTVGLFAFGIAIGATVAKADVIFFEAQLDQAQEVPTPAPVTNASGRAAVTLDTDASQIAWVIQFFDMSGPLTGVHFHGPAPSGEATGITLDIGEVSGLDNPLNGSATLTPEQAADLMNGLWYVNLHTELNPPGEIRGQLTRR
ncbi:MAG: CHRD domain-containing protein [Alphaproteobacteria bacterium]